MCNYFKSNRNQALYIESLLQNSEQEELFNTIKRLFGSVGNNPSISYGFHCDFGDNIHVGDNFYTGKHYASVMNIHEFFADSLGKQAANVISNALTRDISKRFAT